MRSTLVVLSLAALGLLVYYGGFVVGPKIQAGVAADAQAAAQRIDAGARVSLHALDAEITGSVASEEARENIKRAVKRVPGVRAVVDKLEVSAAAVVPVVEPVPVAKVPEVVEVVLPAAVEPEVVVEADVAVVVPDVAPEEDAGSDEALAVENPAAEPVVAVVAELPPMVELKWDGSVLTVAGAGSKALVDAMNELMLREFVAEEFVGELVETATAAPAGFEAGAKGLSQLLATTKSGSFRIEDKLLKVDVVVVDGPAKALFTRGLARIPAAFKRTVNVAIAPAAPVEVAPVEVAPVEVAPVEVAPVEVAPVEVAPTKVAPAEAVKAPVRDPGGALTNAQCQQLINASLDGPDKGFIFTRSGSSRLAPESAAKIDEIAGYLKRCPEAKGVIEGFHHNYGDPDEIRTLTRKRAFSVHAGLVAAGIDGKRFTYQGLGYNYPKYPNKLETRHLNERVEFKLGVD